MLQTSAIVPKMSLLSLDCFLRGNTISYQEKKKLNRRPASPAMNSRSNAVSNPATGIRSKVASCSKTTQPWGSKENFTAEIWCDGLCM
jgi:hypothetical protein